MRALAVSVGLACILTGLATGTTLLAFGDTLQDLVPSYLPFNNYGASSVYSRVVAPGVREMLRPPANAPQNLPPAAPYPQYNGYPNTSQPYTQNYPPVFLQLNKAEYGPNEQILVQYSVPPDLPGTKFLNILDAAYPHGDGAADNQHELSYRTLPQLLRGQIQMDAPKIPGRYDVRLDTSSREYYAVPFTVVQKSFIHTLPGVQLMLDKSVYQPGETINVSFQSSPQLNGGIYIGMMDAKYPHGDGDLANRNELSYQSIGNYLSGVKQFKAPVKPGEYDFRFHTANREYYAVPFSVQSASNARATTRARIVPPSSHQPVRKK